MLPIVYINLDSDTDRRRCMEAEFERAGLAGRRFQAIRWALLPLAEQAKLYSTELNQRQFHKPLVNGEKGCYASHLAAWQSLLTSDHAALVVLEDDVALKPAFAAVIEAIERLPADWDMIKLIGRLDERKPEKLSSAAPLIDAFSLVHYRRVPSLTAAYVVSRSGAQKLLASRQPFGRPVDVDLRHWWENQLRIRGVVPAVIALDETSLQSSIGAKPPDAGPRARWRKFCLKAGYTWLNRWHRP